MILKNLWRRRVRTSLTIGGIAIGISVVVALLMMADALADQFSDLMASGSAELSLIQAGIADTSFSALDEEIGRSISSLPEVEWVSGLLMQIVALEEKPFFFVLGLNPQSPAIKDFRVVQGKGLEKEGELLLGLWRQMRLGRARVIRSSSRVGLFTSSGSTRLEWVMRMLVG